MERRRPGWPSRVEARTAPQPACAGRAFNHVAALPDDVDRPGITDDDRERMGDFLDKSYLDRTVNDLLPDDEECEE